MKKRMRLAILMLAGVLAYFEISPLQFFDRLDERFRNEASPEFAEIAA